jgi:hypothetical protein
MVNGQRLQRDISASPNTNSMKNRKFADHKHTCKTLENTCQNSFGSDTFYHCKRRGYKKSERLNLTIITGIQTDLKVNP